ncbi:hypothetical protein K438DRAFT_1978277 [Mycena galopus ATCC 62051]|nr:hypothetical protein K438DRAFT_1994560 [Mycena galopus ATCC 62051]KAF8177959.1 hypothetical protein K438DRAFT_1978277 [Mycena galopus ATCC 62051]
MGRARDVGLHCSADTYDLFNPVEDEVRKRTSGTFWDKQLSGHFGRVPMLRDCDVSEPAPVDNEDVTREAVDAPVLPRYGVPLVRSPGRKPNLNAFLIRAGAHELREEEALLDRGL